LVQSFLEKHEKRREKKTNGSRKKFQSPLETGDAITIQKNTEKGEKGNMIRRRG